MNGIAFAVIECVLLSIPTAIYVCLRRRRGDRGRPAMGLTWGAASTWAGDAERRSEKEPLPTYVSRRVLSGLGDAVVRSRA